MKRAALLFALFLAGCASTPEGAKPGVAWMLNGPPTSGKALYLSVNCQPYQIIRKPIAEYQELTRDEYKGYHIPSDALLAAYSWHAGFGDIVYVLRKGNTLEVYRQEMDESEEPSHYPVKKIRTISL